MNACMLAEYLAERYVEEWRSNPTWKIKSFRVRVLNELGIQIGYSLAWLARARAKLMIYGLALEQYSRVWDYGKVVLKYNPNSGVYVVVEGVDKPETPIFLRMYICLANLKNRFNKGCRHIIGLDGCHLKGAYPGQILVVVGKDGKNQIFPFAWATVEVENKETWGWFIECLRKDVGDVSGGLGITFMSDRQKGLLQAFDDLVLLAKKRYCVRHIWANFKLQFTRSTFKELFWNAARTTTLFDFEVAMESIKFLSEDDFECLANIPAKHWSRHAFDDFCKSNMLLNNLCETFNAVIKDAKDKPILTQMEWLRNYMMKWNCEKWEVVQKVDGKNMTYVGKLTGIPCVHKFACILDKRVDLDDYVDAYYSRATYILAYEAATNLMPGPKHWDRVDLRQPVPPPIRVMPGRPKSKKRKLKKGECASGSKEPQPKAPKFQNRCRNCGQLGHYAKTCGNELKSEATTFEPKLSTKPVLNTP
ncbi:uncharacterized protein LOC110737778 [Chenopodium quinoa]|uniref:uncharacterized protein LOC110737778 n=1 Tax=Chenopodium quinoa TaxID=63459 RepID=UPI000B780A3E|nr:uncharacterized protein LOC110737778 [Chenopodium quinoa]